MVMVNTYVDRAELADRLMRISERVKHELPSTHPAHTDPMRRLCFDILNIIQGNVTVTEQSDTD